MYKPVQLKANRQISCERFESVQVGRHLTLMRIRSECASSKTNRGVSGRVLQFTSVVIPSANVIPGAMLKPVIMLNFRSYFKLGLELIQPYQFPPLFRCAAGMASGGNPVTPHFELL